VVYRAQCRLIRYYDNAYAIITSMNRHAQQGFTIIELLFFVVISGMLTVALLVGWTVTVNAQNYKDSARSFAVALQDQYDGAANVTIDRDADYQCQRDTATSVKVTEVAGGSQFSRGSSDCVVMGKYIYLSNGNVTTRPVLGIQPGAGIPLPATDKAIIQAYSPTVLSEGITSIPISSFTVPWSTQPYLKGTPMTQTMNMVMVIVQSPVTGTLYTYHAMVTSGAPLPSVRTVVSSGSQSELMLCLNPDAVVGQGTLAVRLDANASSSEAVSVVGDASNGCS